MNVIETLAHKIRFWEYQAGESFTDYFLDRCRYDDAWMGFLERKGYYALIEEIKSERYPDQQLRFEIHNKAWEDAEESHGWSEEEYFKDACLWAEFILSNTMILEELEDFFSEDYESYFEDYNPEVAYGLD